MVSCFHVGDSFVEVRGGLIYIRRLAGRHSSVYGNV